MAVASVSQYHLKVAWTFLIPERKSTAGLGKLEQPFPTATTWTAYIGPQVSPFRMQNVLTPELLQEA